MTSNERQRLVQKLMQEGYIKSENVKKAFLHTPRELFVPNQSKNHAYVDSPLTIGQGQTISAPHMVALMCEILDIQQGQNILEIGAGSGYHAAIVSQLIGKTGHIHSVERYPQLAAVAKTNLKNNNITNVHIHIGDGSQGLPEYAPYDRIYVTCAAPQVPPPLLEQLHDNGLLLIPVGRYICTLELLHKKAGQIQKTEHGGCVFVPLIGKYGH